MDNNSINLAMRQTPWYQQWFQGKGLDPNHVKLSDQQRQELASVAAQHGMPLPHNTIIDQAGNVGEHKGFAGQPGWLKALEIGGAGTAAAMFGGPALMSVFGHAAAPGAVAGTTSATGAATTVTPLAASVGAPGALSSSILTPTIASHAVTTGMAGLEPSLAGASTIGGVVGAPTASGLSRFLPKQATPDNLADAGNVLGSFSEAEANNRMAKGDMTQGHDRLMLDAAGNRRTDETDALRKLAQTAYIGSGGSQFHPPTITLSGQQRTAPDLGYGPTGSSDAQKQAAATLQSQLLARMQPGGSYTPAPLDSYANRGTAERLSNYGSAALSGLGTARKIFGF